MFVLFNAGYHHCKFCVFIAYKINCVVVSCHSYLYIQLVFVAKMAPLSLTKYYIAGVTSELTAMATLMCNGNSPSR